MRDRDGTRARLMQQFTRALADLERECWTRLLADGDLDLDEVDALIGEARARNRAKIVAAVDRLLQAQGSRV